MTFIINEEEALKARLKGLIVSDEKNDEREVGVWFTKPDLESKKQSYPYLTIELLDMNQANYRQTYGELWDNDSHGTVEPVDKNSYVYTIPVAWDLVYQITSYSRHPRHDRAIIAHILNNVFPGKRGYLAVPNDLGTEYGYRHMILEEFTKRDTVEDGRRLYRNVFTVTVSSEGTPNATGPVPDVEVVVVNAETIHIPDELTPL